MPLWHELNDGTYVPFVFNQIAYHYVLELSFLTLGPIIYSYVIFGPSRSLI